MGAVSDSLQEQALRLRSATGLPKLGVLDWKRVCFRMRIE